MTGNGDPPLTRLTAAAGDLPDTNIAFSEHWNCVTSENLSYLEEEKPAKNEAKNEIHFPNLGLPENFLR